RRRGTGDGERGLDQLGRDAVLVGDEGAGEVALDDLGVARALEQASRDAETHGVQADVCEVGAGYLPAVLQRAVLHGVVLFDLRLGQVEAAERVDVREVGTLGEAQTTARDLDLGDGPDAVRGLQAGAEVVHRLGRGAPASRRRERTAREASLVDGLGQDLLEVVLRRRTRDETVTTTLGDREGGQLDPR